MKIWFPTIKVHSGSDVYVSRLASSLQRHGIETVVTDFASLYEFVPFLLRYKRAPTGTDIIHANSWYAFAFSRSSIPVVATIHSPTLSPDFNKYKTASQRLYHQLFVKRNEHRSILNAALVTAVSNFTSSSSESVHAVSRINTVYNYVDSGYFQPVKKLPYSPDRPFRLLYVGNLRYLKGADLLEPIMKGLGSGFTLTATCGLRGNQVKPVADNIRLVGRLDGIDLVKAYQNADALLFPSRMEGFGLVALEAMACGTPVIASNNSSIPEVIENNHTGILCDTGNIESFIRACLTLRNNPQLVSEYGKNARKRAVEMFSEDRIIKKYIELYRSVLR